MYDIGTRVYCKSQDRVGTVEEREYLGNPKRAAYLVVFGPGDDFQTGSDDLRRADFCCDGCGRYLSHSSRAIEAADAEGNYIGTFCFLCSLDAERAREPDYDPWPRVPKLMPRWRCSDA